MSRRIRLLVGFLLAISIGLNAQEQSSNGFIPNKGQWNNQVLYRMSIPNGAMFLEQNGFSYTFYDGTYLAALHDHHTPETPLPEKIKTHTIRVKLEGASQQVTPQPEGPSATRYNYFTGNDPLHWASGLSAYNMVHYPEVYPGTAMKLYLHNNQVKYDFILKPGADLSQIRMNYQGAEHIAIREGKLIIKTSLGEITEQVPIAWQTDGGLKIPVECHFIMNLDGTVGFEVPNLDTQLELVVDPQIVFVTYSGSVDDNWGFTATNDNEGNGYAAGVVFGSHFQTSPGAAQQVFGGGVVDIGIIKYNPTGTQALYITYIGGNRSEFPHSLIVNEYNELIMFGTTGSSDFPVTSGAYSSAFKGGTSTGFSIMSMPSGSDIFICRLSVNGENLLASTLVGGSKNDGLNNGNNNDLVRNYADQTRGALWVDANNNIYVGTSTLSEDFPGTAGNFQPNYGGGGQDGIVLKMNGNLTQLLWATYLGGSASDGIFYLTVDNKQNVVVTGGTRSENFPVSSGAWKTTFGGGSQPDGFVSKLDSSGKHLIASTYVGTPEYDQAYIAGTDITDHVYLFGQTSATGSEFVINSSIGIIGGNQFIIKLDPTLSQVVWSTTFGKALGKPDISPTALLVDVCDKIYVCGWGGNLNGPFNASISGMTTTQDAIKSTTDGNDFYLYVINSQASALEYASFFGGDWSRDHVDGGTSRFDRKGVIYQAICASCGGYDDLPVTPGAYSPTNNSTNCNNALVKFDFESPIVISSFVLADSSGENLSAPVGCAPFQMKFKNTSINATQFIWKIDGTDVSTDVDLSNLFATSGKYEITLVATSSGTCNISDTSHMTITILAAIEGNLLDINACKGTKITLGPEAFDDPYYTFQWSPTFGLDNPWGRRPKLTATKDTTYKLVVRIGTCTDTLLQKINVQGSMTILPSVNLCLSDTATIGAAGPAPDAATFSWSPAGSLSNPAIYHPRAFPSATITYTMLLIQEGHVCPDTLTQRVDVGNGSHVDLPQARACWGDSIMLGPLQPIADVISSTWQPSSDINNPSIQNPQVFAQTSRDYQLILEKTGCNDTLLQRLEVVGQQLSDFPLFEACLGDSVQIGFETPLSGNGIGYFWSPAGLFSDPGIYNPKILTSGNKQFTVIINWPLDGCSDTLGLDVKALMDQFNAGPDVTACKGLPVEIGIPDPNGMYTYDWTPEALVSNPQLAATQANVVVPTQFWLTRTPAGTTPGCKAIDSLFVNIAENPLAGFGYEVIPGCEALGIQFRDSSQNASQLNWIFRDGDHSSDTEPLVHVAYGDTLSVLQIAIQGTCRDSMALLEKLKNLGDYYKLQDVNVFSPNGDGVNDCFSPALQQGPKGLDETFVACSALMVYNRWGDVIYDSEKKGLPACWDGISQGGTELPEGIYFYRYTFKGDAHAGYVHLIRH